MRFAWKVWFAVVAAVLMAGCGGGTDRTKAQVRLVNASTGYTALDWIVAGQLRQGGVAYGQTGDYVDIDPGNDDSTINSAGSSTALVSFTPSVSKDSHYSLLAYGNAGSLAEVVLDENQGKPDSGKALLRVINAAADAGSVDVYLTGSDDSLAASVPVLSGATAGTLGDWITLTSGTWRLRITAAGSKTDLRLDYSSLTLNNQQIATLVLTPGRGGVLVNALLVSQQDAISRFDGSQARLRVAAGVASGGAVSATVGGTTLMSGVGSPAVGLYTLVSSGQDATALSVNGVALSTATLNLAAGGDYTLLVYGATDAAQASLIEDDNHLPTDSTLAKVRLVNGISDLSNPLAMTIDYVPLADGVAAGAASADGTLAATTTAVLSVTSAGLASPLISATDQTFVAGANYTVFAVGASGSAVGIVRKDR